MGCFITKAQNTANVFILKGYVKNRDTGNIILGYPLDATNRVKDTVTIINGNFRFEGKLPGIVYATLVGKNGYYAQFFLEPAMQEIQLDENNYSHFKMTGSYTQQQHDSLNEQVGGYDIKAKDYTAKRNEIIIKTKADTTDAIHKYNEVVDKLQEKIDSLRHLILQNDIAFIAQHPDSYIGPTIIYGYILQGRLSTDNAIKIYNGLTTNIQQSIGGQLLFNELKKRSLNQPAANFIATDYKNNPVSLNSFRGKYVLINFGASWCAPCIEKIPALKTGLLQYKHLGFEIINISVDTAPEKWMAAIKKNKLESFTQLIINNNIDENYGNFKYAIPNWILINREGIIVANNMMNGASFENSLKKEFDKDNSSYAQ